MKLWMVVVWSTLLLVGCITQPTGAGRTLPWQSSIATITQQPDGTVTTIAATPAEQATAVWVRYGAIMAVVGILAMLPIFGGNIRTGALIALGGVGMAITGKFVGDISFTIPAWLLPALSILIAAGMLWGYHVRAAQAKESHHD